MIPPEARDHASDPAQMIDRTATKPVVPVSIARTSKGSSSFSPLRPQMSLRSPVPQTTLMSNEAPMQAPLGDPEILEKMRWYPQALSTLCAWLQAAMPSHETHIVTLPRPPSSFDVRQTMAFRRFALRQCAAALRSAHHADTDLIARDLPFSGPDVTQIQVCPNRVGLARMTFSDGRMVWTVEQTGETVSVEVPSLQSGPGLLRPDWQAFVDDPMRPLSDAVLTLEEDTYPTALLGTGSNQLPPPSELWLRPLFFRMLQYVFQKKRVRSKKTPKQIY